jgi:hypothetical protein
MDLRLDVNRLLVEPSVHDAPTHRCVIDRGSGRYDIVFHLPTGVDQEDVVDEAMADPEAAARRLLIRCIETVNGVETSEIPATAAAGLPAIMAGIDTQAEVMLDATCPACGSAVRALFDAGTFVHREIDRTWRDIHREVHLLASHYHWSEEEILRLGSSKRRLYLDFVEEAVRSSS